MAPAKVGGRAGMKFLNVGMSMMSGTLGKLLGGQFLRDVQTFVAAMDTMFGGFRSRADATYKLLQAPGTAFLVVATPEQDALREAAYFVERLAAEKMPLAGLVLNRVHGSEASRLSAEQALTAAENLGDTRIVDQRAGKAGLGDQEAPDPAVTASGPTEPPLSPEAAQASGPEPAAEHEDTTENEPPHENIATSATTPDHAASPADASGPVGATANEAVDIKAVGVEELTAGLLRLHAERMQIVAREHRTRDRFTALHPEVPVTAGGAAR